MILSDLVPGVAFGTMVDGDGRTDKSARVAISDDLGISRAWAYANQVHGNHVAWVSNPGFVGDGDGAATGESALPLAIGTADCVPVAMRGVSTIALVHAGWRGVANGVIRSAIDLMTHQGDAPVAASIGPHIGPCCYEVGEEVVDALGGFVSETRWGTRSVDMALAISDQLGSAEIELVRACTMDDPRFYSYRENATTMRQVSLAWLP